MAVVACILREKDCVKLSEVLFISLPYRLFAASRRVFSVPCQSGCQDKDNLNRNNRTASGTGSKRIQKNTPVCHHSVLALCPIRGIRVTQETVSTRSNRLCKGKDKDMERLIQERT
jgi:hypothetical protein